MFFFSPVMNSFLRKMGVPAAWEINDVYGLEPELLSMLPQPALALLLLFPINDKAEPRINGEQFSASD
jgi:ubiquitin carboxyl-terminal hydrolase L3